MFETATNHPPHRHNEDPEGEPINLPVEPDEGPVPVSIPDEPEQHPV